MHIVTKSLKTSIFSIWWMMSVCLSVVPYAFSKNAAVTHEEGGQFKVAVDENGKYWFIDPQGKRFLSIGINDIVSKPFRPRPNTKYYDPVGHQFDNNDGWKEEVFSVLKQNGFNTLGAWSDGQLYDGPIYGTICLYVAGFAQDRCLDGLRPGFADRVRENTNITLEKYPDLKNTFGVFLDNEMPWYGHGIWGDIPNFTLLEAALQLNEDDEARMAAVEFLKKRYDSPEALSKAWAKPLASWRELTFEYARSCINSRVNQDRAEFIEFAADAFYKTASTVVHEMLPGKLILGTRYAMYAPEPVIRACGRYCDVISFNDYRPSPIPDEDMLASYWIWGGKKPLMVTEFSWRAEENTSGNPNSGGAGAVVKTQAQRGENYKSYVEKILSYPMVVGVHWFEFSDQSPQGRFDGENSNYGIVDISHRPYTELLSAMKQANENSPNLHANSDLQSPKSLPARKAVVFQPGQRPDRLPSVDLLANPVKGPEVFKAPDAEITLEKKSDHLLAAIDTGRQWGCGVLFFGPEQFKISSGPQYSTNLDGYSVLELDAAIGQGTIFDIFVDEAGTNVPSSVSYDTSAGDDGEAFVISQNQGLGKRSLYRFELKNLQCRDSWGNQKGQRRVDLHAMKGISIYVNGGQAKDQIRIYSLRLVR